VDRVDVIEGVAAHGQEVGILAGLERAGDIGDPWEADLLPTTWPRRLPALQFGRVNPFGPAVRGWDQASQALEYASSRFRDGEVTAFEEVARYASADLVVIHEKEQWQAKVSGGEELSRFGLRVTSTFRREDSTWKLVHRHADPITTADPKGPLRGSAM
jgi:ketosteroid isomerase-like protein